MNLFSGLSWNVRGCNKLTNRKNVKSHTQNLKVNFLCLQETKCLGWIDGTINSIWDANIHNWLEAPSCGHSGGLLTSWDARVYHLNSHIITNNWILFRGHTINTNVHFICINVYAPQSISDKSVIWDQLSNILNAYEDIATVLMGDFNSAREGTDRENCLHCNVDAQLFNDFINNNGLINIKTQVPHFTWFGPSHKKSKLDWIFVNKAWLSNHNW